MMKYKKKSTKFKPSCLQYFSCLSLLLSINLPVAAGNVHEHGKANIQLVIENQTIHVQFTSPADSVLGFEHQAVSPQEIARVKQAEQLLANHSNVIHFENLNCESKESVVDIGALLPIKSESQPEQTADHSRHTDKLHDEHLHDHAHDHDKHEHEEHKHHAKNHGRHADVPKSQHFEITTNYTLHCHNINDLEAVAINAFTQFNALHEISLVWLKGNKQGAIELNQAANSFQLR